MDDIWTQAKIFLALILSFYWTKQHNGRFPPELIDAELYTCCDRWRYQSIPKNP